MFTKWRCCLFAAPTRFLSDRVEIGRPQQLFRSLFAEAGVSIDGQRFLMFTRANEEAMDRNPLTVVLNWRAALK
jgi:hypothetical protein